MEGKFHFSLKGSPDIFQTKGHFLVREGTPRTNESSFMLVFRFYLNLIVSEETIHKREHFTSHASIYNLVYKWRGIVVLRTGFVQISKVSTDVYGPFLFINRNRVGYPFRQSYGINETDFNSFSTSTFTTATLHGLTGLNFCQIGLASKYV